MKIKIHMFPVLFFVLIFFNTTIIENLSAQCSDVGTINGISNFTGQSTRNNLSDTIFLCWEDRFSIDHNNDFDLKGDPDLSTPAGIGYAWYKSKPTISGDTRTTIKTDDVYQKSGDIEMMITVDDLNGDCEFSNSPFSGKTFSETFIGLGDPAIVYYAPITVDKRIGKRGYFENGGPCVKANPNESFPVVYLHPIEISDIQYKVDGNPLKVSFLVTGGVPEFYGSGSKYTKINVFDTDYSQNPQGTVHTTIFSHGERVIVTLPRFGEFDVVISDDISCASNAPLKVSNALNPTFIIDTISGQPGDSVCITFSVKDYENIAEAGITIDFDPAVLDFGEKKDLIPGNYSASLIPPGKILVTWLTSDTTNTFLDNTGLFLLCFKLKNKVGECSPITIASSYAVNNEGIDVYPYYDDGLVCIEPPNGLFVSAIHCGADFGKPEASLTFKVYNGVPPYTYTLRKGGLIIESGTVSDELIETTIFGLVPGVDYTLEVIDSNLDTYFYLDAITGLSPFSISQQLPLNIESISIIKPACYGEPDGEIHLKVEDGDFFPHSIKWSNNIFNKDILTGLGNGIYGVTIVDQATGCKIDTFVTLYTPPLKLDFQVLDLPSCKGVNDGRVLATVTGGTPFPLPNGYHFEWESGSEELKESTSGISAFSKVGEGKLIFEVHDSAAWCKIKDTFELDVKYTMEVENFPQDPSCYGEEDGEILFVSNLIGYPNDGFDIGFPYFPFPDYDKFGSDSFRLKNLGSGRYIVNISEINLGCEISDTVWLDDPSPMGFTIETNKVCCETNQKAYAKFNFHNGVSPFTIKGIGSDVTVNTAHRFEDLLIGQYTIVITDNNGCDSTVVFEIMKDVGCLNIDTIKFDLLGCDASATTDIIVEASSTHGVISYKWTNENGDPLPGITNTLSNKGAGTYIVIVKDDDCTLTDTIVIPEANPFEFTTVVTDAECAEGELGGFGGDILITITGGNAGYSFDWNNGMVGSHLTGIGAGEYVVTISDNSGCADTDTVIVVGAPPIEINILDIQGISCSDDQHNDGSVVIEANGGNNTTGLYNFRINNGSNQVGTVVGIENLSSGKNYVSVSYNTINGNTCSKVDSFDISVPEKLLLDKLKTKVVTPSCFGDCDGKAIVSAKGGNSVAYFYHWQETGDDGVVGFDLCAGTYHIQITDANLCVVIDSITITEPAELIAVIDSINTKDVNCSGNNSGQISIKHTGGNTDGPFTYEWSPDVSTTKLATDLAKGIYSVTVTDHKGCSSFVTYEVKGQSQIVFSAYADTIKCFGDKTCIYIDTVYGGSGPDYGFSINGGGVFPIGSCREVYASEEPYLISVFDSEGCKEEMELKVTQPAEIIVDLGEDLVIDLGDSKIVHLNTNTTISKVDWTIDSLKIKYEFLNDLHSELEIEAISNDVIYVTVEDINGCTASGELNVSVNTFRNVYVPNIFTPDGDGLNDEFKLRIGKGIQKISYMKIYNRWGELMHFEENLLPSNGYTGAWDGTYKGRRVNSGVYVYMVKILFQDSREILYRGSVTLMR